MKTSLRFRAGRLKHGLRSVDIGLDGSNRAFHDEFHAHGSGEMENDVGLVHQFGQQMTVFQGFEKIVHPVILLEVPDILHAPGGKIVHQQDLVAALKQTFRQVRTDKPRTAGD